MSRSGCDSCTSATRRTSIRTACRRLTRWSGPRSALMTRTSTGSSFPVRTPVSTTCERQPGFEPGTSTMATSRSAKLSYNRVDLSGFEPPTPGLPNRCATAAPQAQTAQNPYGLRTLHRVSLSGAPRRTRRTGHEGCPTWGVVRGVGFHMPSAVEFSKFIATGRSRDVVHGQQESDPRLPVLETGALPVELRPYVDIKGSE